jgi:16S rRNA (adenine1518-N6/adenine1519-N6)-dimethyltransferase
MASLSGGSESVGVLEIGPGIGVLTKELCKVSKKVVAIELDSRLPELLAETLSEFSNVEIVSGDVLKLDLNKLIEEKFGGERICVCANLPYYITSPVVMALLERKLPIDKITVMVQKEAAERICAPIGSRECGAVSVAVRYYAEPKMQFKVSRGSFMPSPNVDSAVLTLNLRKTPEFSVADEKTFFETVKAAFSMRRKTLSNCLSGIKGISKEEICEIMESVGISPQKRAEQLKMEEFVSLSGAIYERSKASKN